MITRAILEAQRSQYVKGREKVIAEVSAYNGAIEAMDALLGILTEIEQGQAKLQAEAAIQAASKENT